jgi:hypothetical protein
MNGGNQWRRLALQQVAVFLWYTLIMFGIIFIVIGIIILLQAYGVFGALSSGIIWGVAFIIIGITLALRRSARRNRRAEWLAEHRRKRHEGAKEGDDATK